ncbi:MAG: acyltransferase family protein [Syntrophomonadaceae bacterium]|nr:acyltransferase family protein [Syntrophomonadaceae bacterium]
MERLGELDTNIKSKRDYSIDLLKSIAIIGVIVIHTCSYNYEIASLNWTGSVFWGSVVRASVPIFFMCSGASFLSSDQPLSIKKLFGKSLPRIIVAMLVWALFYKVFHLAFGGSLTLAHLIQGLKEVLLFNQEFHLYYLQILVMVYLFLPISRVLTQNASQKELQYLLLLWFVFGIIYPTLISFWPFNLMSGIAIQYKINMTYAAIGYSILGFYLKQYPINNIKWYWVLSLGGFLFVFVGTYYISANNGLLYTGFLEGMSLGVALLAAGIFGLGSSLTTPDNELLRKSIAFISKASFCIFLTHMFFIYLLRMNGLSVSIWPTIISIPLITLLIFTYSLLLYPILARIPVVNKWLI